MSVQQVNKILKKISDAKYKYTESGPMGRNYARVYYTKKSRKRLRKDGKRLLKRINRRLGKYESTADYSSP